MFRIDARPTFEAVVTVKVPNGDEIVEEPFKAKFKAFPDSELAQFNQFSVDGQKDLLRHVVLELSDIVGDDDKPITFTPDLLEKVMDWQHARTALQVAYVRGLTQAKLGN